MSARVSTAIFMRQTCVSVQLCKAGLKTLQDLGPEMRLALNEDLEEEEEEVMMEEEELEEDTAAYKVQQSSLCHSDHLCVFVLIHV